MHRRPGAKDNFRRRPAGDLENIVNLKLHFIGLALLGLLSAGCASDQEPIVFLSEVKVPASVAEPALGSPGLSMDDEGKIDLVIFSYLVDHKVWKDGTYSALFLQADDAVVTAMIRKYPDHVPPIKPADHLDLRSAQSPLDRDTGLPVLIFSADVDEPGADGSVTATGRWYAGIAAKGSVTLTLKTTGKDWTITGVK